MKSNVPEVPQRINVVGSSGSGKSTFSKRLAEILNIKHLEMDAMFWGPNWYWPSDEEFFGKIEAALQTDDWILDGNYTRTIPLKWRRVQTVVWLDYSFSRTIFQSVKRAMSRIMSQKELWPDTGNRETFRKSFLSKDSIILWSINNYHKVKRNYELVIADKVYSHLEFIRLTSPKAADAYLHSLAERISANRQRHRGEL